MTTSEPHAGQGLAFDILSRSTRCFCKVPIQDLLHWAHRRYIEGIPTLRLLHEAPTQRDRELISIVALLDVDAETLTRVIGHLAKPTCHLEACRDQVRQWLEVMLPDQ